MRTKVNGEDISTLLTTLNTKGFVNGDKLGHIIINHIEKILNAKSSVILIELFEKLLDIGVEYKIYTTIYYILNRYCKKNKYLFILQHIYFDGYRQALVEAYSYFNNNIIIDIYNSNVPTTFVHKDTRHNIECFDLEVINELLLQQGCVEIDINDVLYDIIYGNPLYSKKIITLKNQCVYYIHMHGTTVDISYEQINGNKNTVLIDDISAVQQLIRMCRLKYISKL